MKRLPLHILLALLAFGLSACPTPADDDDSAADDDDDDTVGDDDDSVGDDDDDDSAGDDDDSAGDDDDAPDTSSYALMTHAPFGGDATLATVDASDNAVSDDILGLSGSDWVIAVADGDPWLLGRSSDTVRRYSGLDFSAPTLEFSTGGGTNPHALAVCGDRIFVTRYNQNEDQTAGGDVAIFDLATGGPLGTVDLSSFNPHADGTSEPDAIVQVGDSIYVNLQLLDRDNGWAADPSAKLVKIDCATATVTGDWDVGGNPFIASVASDPTLIQVRHDTGVQLFDTLDGSVEDVVVDTELGEGYNTIEVAFSGSSALLVAEVNWATNEIWCLDVASGALTLLDSVDQRGWSSAVAPDGNVWMLWRDHWSTPDDVEPGGVAIYDPATCSEVTSSWLSFATDPYTITFFEMAN